MTRPDEIDIRERLRWRTSADEFEEIRSLWIAHSKAEDAHALRSKLGRQASGKALHGGARHTKAATKRKAQA